MKQKRYTGVLEGICMNNCAVDAWVIVAKWMVSTHAGKRGMREAGKQIRANF